MKKNNSYFKVYRSLLASDMWLKEPFTHGQAWIDLIGLANWERKENFYKGSFQIIKRGQIAASLGFFEKRWKWSRNKVKHFFEQLSARAMVSIESTTNGTTITIENYAIYQSRGTSEGTSEGVSEGTSEGISEGTQKKNKKNNKKINGPQNEIVRTRIVNGVEYDYVVVEEL